MDKPQKGIDLQVIEQLFRTEYKSLCNSAYRITNDRFAAQDVVQEVFVKLWNKKGELTIETSPRAYLFKAVVNSALNYLESNKKFIKLRQEINHGNLPEVAIHESDKLEEQELQERLEQALNRLPPKCKTIFILCKYEGMKYQQIADHLNLSLKTVENQMGIALQKLREDLKTYASREFLFWPLICILLGL